MSRYDSAKKTKNQEELYQELLEERQVKSITHYRTPRFPILSAEVRRRFTTLPHTWKMGDSYWKLAAKHYGNASLWWVIAWYNEKPTEAHLHSGQPILIPTPLEEVLSFFHFGA
jgi:nucleoid-associated protein YgaU